MAVHPRLRDGNHPNLHVLVEHEVIRVIVEDGRAVGVETRGVGAVVQNGTQFQTIKSKKMVVISAGTLGTPLMLER